MNIAIPKYKEIARAETLGVENLALDLASVKEHLRLDSSDASDDDYLNGLIKSVSNDFEEITNRFLIATTFKTCREFFQKIFELRRANFQSVENIKYYDISGTLQTVASSNYNVSDAYPYASTVFKSVFQYPILEDEKPQPIEIEFKAGYGDTYVNIPQDVRMALKNMVLYLYENRGDCSSGNYPDAYKKTIMKYKIKSFGGC